MNLQCSLTDMFSPGAVRSHLSDFKKHRAARIDHYVVEVNKLIIRLEKVNGVLFDYFIFLPLAMLHRLFLVQVLLLMPTAMLCQYIGLLSSLCLVLGTEKPALFKIILHFLISERIAKPLPGL